MHHLHKMSLLSLVLVSSAFVTSVRNLTSIAETGMQMIFFSLVAAFLFFIPVALVSAELSTGWPKNGGIYVWVKEAFNEKWAFFAITMQWYYAVLGIISALYLGADSLLYVVAPSFMGHRGAIIIISLILIWTFTFLSLLGQKTSSLISSVCFALGVIFPALLIIGLGLVYLLIGEKPQMDMSFTWDNMVPDFSKTSSLVMLVSLMRAFAGVEAGASHANEVENPKRNYPISILFVVLIGLIVNIFGSMSVAIVIPQKDISLAAGLIDAFKLFLTFFHLDSYINVLAILIVLGAIGSINTWIMGPIKGLLATAENGDLPPILQSVTKKGAPTHLLFFQGLAMSLATIVLLFLPTVNLAFWASIALSMIVYSLMYILLLLSGIRLRYKEPNQVRKYRVPFGNFGIWLIGIIGITTLVFVFIIDFIPPSELSSDMHGLYTLSLVGAAAFLISLPLLIFHLRKPYWKRIE